jgi:hypothetical protein
VATTGRFIDVRQRATFDQLAFAGMFGGAADRRRARGGGRWRYRMLMLNPERMA